MNAMHITLVVVAASVVTFTYPIALFYYRAQDIRHARRIIRRYVAEACKGDALAREQVSRASYVLRGYNL